MYCHFKFKEKKANVHIKHGFAEIVLYPACFCFLFTHKCLCYLRCGPVAFSLKSEPIWFKGSKTLGVGQFCGCMMHKVWKEKTKSHISTASHFAHSANSDRHGILGLAWPEPREVQLFTCGNLTNVIHVTNNRLPPSHLFSVLLLPIKLRFTRLCILEKTTWLWTTRLLISHW